MLELDNRISLKRKPDSYDPKQILVAIALFALSLLNKYIYIYMYKKVNSRLFWLLLLLKQFNNSGMVSWNLKYLHLEIMAWRQWWLRFRNWGYAELMRQLVRSRNAYSSFYPESDRIGSDLHLSSRREWSDQSLMLYFGKAQFAKTEWRKREILYGRSEVMFDAGKELFVCVYNNILKDKVAYFVVLPWLSGERFFLQKLKILHFFLSNSKIISGDRPFSKDAAAKLKGGIVIYICSPFGMKYELYIWRNKCLKNFSPRDL